MSMTTATASDDTSADPPHDPVTGEVLEDEKAASARRIAEARAELAAIRDSRNLIRKVKRPAREWYTDSDGTRVSGRHEVERGPFSPNQLGPSILWHDGCYYTN